MSLTEARRLRRGELSGTTWGLPGRREKKWAFGDLFWAAGCAEGPEVP